MRKKIKASDNPKPFGPGENGRKGKRYIPPEVRAFNVMMAQRGHQRAKPELVRTAFEYLLGLSIKNLREIAGSANDNSNRYPAFIRLAAVAMLQEGFAAVERILKLIHPQRAYLSIDAKSTIEITSINADTIEKIQHLLAECRSDEEPNANGQEIDVVDYLDDV
ncbi:MAG: hypothetical protein QXR53_04980 [Candidatus Norongarragalinales archaeon]